MPNKLKPYTIFAKQQITCHLKKMMLDNTVRKTKEAENMLISIQEKHAKHVCTKRAIFNAPIQKPEGLTAMAHVH